VGDHPGEEIAHLLRREVAIQQPVTGNGNRGRLLGHDQHRRIGLFRQAQRGAVPRPERLVAHLELREGQDAPGADDLIAAHQHGAIVQRRVGREDGGDEVGRHFRFHRDAGRDELFEADVAFDCNYGAGPGARQAIERLGDFFRDRLPVAPGKDSHET